MRPGSGLILISTFRKWYYKYVPDLPFDFDITAMGGTGDLTTFEEDIKEWESHTSRRFKYFSYSGNHFFIKPNEEIILSRINKIIKGKVDSLAKKD